MPRAKANPEPAEEQYTSSAGGKFRIHAWRDGSYDVFEGDTRIHFSPAKTNAGFRSPRWPSNRLQADAIAAAKNWIEVFAHKRV